MNHYQLIFNGSVSEGHSLDQVKRNLAALLKTDEARIEQMFTRLPIILKKNLDQDTAMKYHRVLLQAGAICQVEGAVRSIRPLVMEKAVPPPLPVSGAAEIDRAPQEASVTSESSRNEGIKGLGDIISGVVLIGIGFVIGGSVFMGDATWLDYFFDGLGLFWIGRGIYKMVR